MKKSGKLFIKTLCLLSFFSLVTSCSEEESSGSVNPSIGTGPVNTTPVGTVEASGFWVNAQSLEHTMYVNNGSGFGTDCFIDKDSTTNQLMDCYIDVLEGDLYMNDIELQFNAPPGLCQHVIVTPSWHWNYSSGYGPSAISIAVDSTGDPAVVTGCTATDASGGSGACSAHLELANVDDIAGPTCVYDKSGQNDPNCCFGDYAFTKVDTTNTGVVTTSSNKNWGGSVSTCIGGSVRGSWEIFTQSGYPVSEIHQVPEINGTSGGLNESYKLKANGQSHTMSFSFHASHYETTGTPHSHDGYVLATTTNEPYAVDPVDDLDGSSIIPGSDNFQFDCVDEAFEVKHRIRTYIREWNTLADFVAYNTSSGATYNPDRTGTEGTSCEYDPIFAGEACNDLTDFADILTSVGGTYTTTPGAGAAATRETYFPRAIYK